MSIGNASLFEGDRMVLAEAIELTKDSLLSYAPLYDHWAVAYSGGKDSSATLTIIAHLIETGQVPRPKSLTVLYADTRMELPPLQTSAMKMLAEVRELGWDTRVVLPAIDDRYFVYMFGRGVPPPKNRFRWCTAQIKIEPMLHALQALREEAGQKFLMITGVRLGESAARDARQRNWSNSAQSMEGDVAEHPILFSAPMVRAILDGRKTQTRRVMKVQPCEHLDGFSGLAHHVKGSVWQSGLPARGLCPYGKPGDRLWVKETWTGAWYEGVNDMHLSFAADGGESCVGAPAFYTLPKAAAKPQGWVSPLFMPRWASRITLEITDVRVQRIQDISEADAIAEGVESLEAERYDHDFTVCPQCGGTCLYTSFSGQGGAMFDTDCTKCDTHVKRFRNLWDSINKERGHGWDVNDWVWAVNFKRVEASL